jgi:hypothetical protein
VLITKPAQKQTKHKCSTNTQKQITKQTNKQKYGRKKQHKSTKAKVLNLVKLRQVDFKM